MLALFAASLLLAFLDKKEKARGNQETAHFLARLAIGLFLSAFVGGVVVTLLAGVQKREEMESVNGLSGPERMASIGKIDTEEVRGLEAKAQKDPKDVPSRERLGHLYLQQQDYENVFRLAHESLQVNPKSVESRAHMGMVYFAMQEADQALAQFNQALQIDPKNLEALLFKGIVQFQAKDDLKGAKETWERFMKLSEPGDAGRDRVEMFLQNINSLLR